MSEVSDELLTRMRSTMEDDNKSTRLVTVRVLGHLFVLLGQSLNQDQLHNMYPDLLKRMDDSCDDIRVAMCVTFVAYFASFQVSASIKQPLFDIFNADSSYCLSLFQDNYDVGLYSAHLEQIYKGLLVHLDDPEQRIQEAVLGEGS